LGFVNRQLTVSELKDLIIVYYWHPVFFNSMMLKYPMKTEPLWDYGVNANLTRNYKMRSPSKDMLLSKIWLF
jgi:hypothetical protein